jgi:hypothetical protein
VGPAEPQRSTEEAEGAGWGGRDHANRLVYAMNGAIFARTGGKEVILADFMPQKPRAAPPPEWATHPIDRHSLTQNRRRRAGDRWSRPELTTFRVGDGMPAMTTRRPPFTPADVQRAAAAVAALPEARVREESRRLAPVLSDILGATGRSIAAGTTTGEVSNRLVELAGARGLLPAMLGYHGFPAGAAVSVNEEVLHGLPSGLVIEEGDLLKLQFAVVSDAGYAAQG